MVNLKTFKSIKVPITNNGGFGGGGYGSADGGAGGGGGYSGGGGGTADGFSGGGGSLNNGFRQKNEVTNLGNGYVRISFIGQQCCGPVDVYIAMAFIAGILSKPGIQTRLPITDRLRTQNNQCIPDESFCSVMESIGVGEL